MLRKSALTALVATMTLGAINQGTVLLAGQLPPSLAWQLPLTYAVLFWAASWDVLSNSRRD